MACYHFHFRIGPLLGLDRRGAECLGIDDAIAHAFLVALDKAQLVSEGRRELGVIEVTDAGGTPRFNLPLSSVVSVHDPALRPPHHPKRPSAGYYGADA